MGLAGAMGWDNPFTQFVGNNRQTLMGLGAGIAGGTNIGEGIASGLQMAAQGRQADEAANAQKQAEMQRQQGLNQTIEYMRAKGYDDLVAGVEGGGLDMGTAWGEALRRGQPQEPNLTADMQNFQFAQANPDFASFIGGGSGQAPQIVETYDATTGQPIKGYMQGTEFVPVGGAKAPAARDNPMNSTIQKEIFEADEGVQAGQAVIGGLTRALELNNQAYDGPFADQRSSATALFGDQSGIATQELKNVVTSQALESLKAVFGGMPTEGERKILLEIQGSVDQPKPVRESIYRRAMAAAERRIAASQAKAEGLRSGTYFDPSFGQQAPGGQTSTGLSWSIEP